MHNRVDRYFTMGLIGLAIIAAGCATRDVDVRAPIDAQSTVEGDSSSTRGRGSSADRKLIGARRGAALAAQAAAFPGSRAFAQTAT
jgi:hypothetical protein